MLTLLDFCNTQLPDTWELEVADLLTMTVNKSVDLSPFGEYWVMEINVNPATGLLKVYVTKPKPEWYQFWK